MQIRPIINSVQATLMSQATVAANDPAVEAAVGQLVEALGPALQMAAMEIAEQAAESFLHNGGEKFAHIPCLNDSSEGMKVLERIVRRELSGWVNP